MTDHDMTDLERQLRENLRRRAERISPRERRTEILAMVHDETHTARPQRRWLTPVAAAASVALIGGVAAWGISTRGGSPQTTAAVPSTSTTAPPAGSKLPGSNPGGAGATTAMALPVYFVGTTSGTGDRFGLYREFVRTPVPAGASRAQKAKAAVTVALNAQQFKGESYLQPWSGTSVRDLTVTPSLITVTLSDSGAKGLKPEQTKLALQGLVWTAQAANGLGLVPVKFKVADGSTKLFGAYTTTRTYNRPAKGLEYQVLAPIWVSFPEQNQVLPAGAPMVAEGQSCAFEGTTQWQLKRGGATIKSGTTQATSGCPERGTWKVPLGALPRGAYTFRMYEVSMQDGQGITAETSRTFTVK
jgi:hypothetical protein